MKWKKAKRILGRRLVRWLGERPFCVNDRSSVAVIYLAQFCPSVSLPLLSQWRRIISLVIGECKAEQTPTTTNEKQEETTTRRVKTVGKLVWRQENVRKEHRDPNDNMRRQPDKVPAW